MFIATQVFSQLINVFSFWNNRNRICSNTSVSIIVATNNAYHSFALGWKAMETGWYELAHYQFEHSIGLDSDYYMAYIGMILSNEQMGYGMSDRLVGNYSDRLLWISHQSDVNLRLTYQEQLLLKSLLALHRADNFTHGLTLMETVFDSDKDTLPDYIITILKNYSALILHATWQPLINFAELNLNAFALQLLTHSANPYRATDPSVAAGLRQTALSVVYLYQSLAIGGAHTMSADSIDIAEYYGKWSLARTEIEAQRAFLLSNIGEKETDLLMVNENDIVVRGLDVRYIKISDQSLDEYERLHFYQLQVHVGCHVFTCLFYCMSHIRNIALSSSVRNLFLQKHQSCHKLILLANYIFFIVVHVVALDGKLFMMLWTQINL